MSAWTQGYVNTKPKPVNPFVSMGVPYLLSQQAAAAPVTAQSVAAPAAAPVEAPAGIPDITQDPAYQARIAAILRRRDQAFGDLTLQEGQTRKAYGIGDTSDPYSKAKLLQESFQQNKAATGTSLAARGQLYSGALQNAQNANQRNFNISQDSLQKAYQSAIDAIAQRRVDVGNAAEDDTVGAGSDALSRLLATRPDADLAGASIASDIGDAAGLDTSTPVMQSAIKPKTGYAYVAKSGARKGQSYNIVKSGNKTYHKYANGTTIRVK